MILTLFNVIAHGVATLFVAIIIIGNWRRVGRFTLIAWVLLFGIVAWLGGAYTLRACCINEGQMAALLRPSNPIIAAVVVFASVAILRLHVRIRAVEKRHRLFIDAMRVRDAGLD